MGKDVDLLTIAGKTFTSRLFVGTGKYSSPAVMVRGVFLGVKHAARLMIPRGGGSIINTASIAGLSSGAPPTAYSACKAAVISFTRNAANELAEHELPTEQQRHHDPQLEHQVGRGKLEDHRRREVRNFGGRCRSDSDAGSRRGR